MRIDVLTLFPDMFEGVFGSSILGKARDKGLVTLTTVNFRDFSTNKHNTVDDTPYGGGGGMVLKPEPIFGAVEHVLGVKGAEQAAGASGSEPDADGLEGAEAADKPEAAGTGIRATDAEAVEDVEAAAHTDVSIAEAGGAERAARVILMCPQGEPFTQRKAEELAEERHLVFICGHYEGYDERIREHLITDELSIGDYVLTGGELPAMVVIDAVVRLLPGVLGNERSAVTDSFGDGLLEYPHYTRPPEYRGWAVPDVLLSGHHAEIERWRRRQSLERTLSRRPDLLDRAELSPKERQWLAERRAGDGADPS